MTTSEEKQDYIISLMERIDAGQKDTKEWMATTSKRIDLLETAFLPVQRHVFMIEGAGRAIVVVAGILALAKGFYEAFRLVALMAS